GLKQCKGRDWFDCITAHPLSELGLPFSSPDKVVSVQSNELVLEAFKKMEENVIGGLPIVEGPKRKIIGNLSIRDIRFLLLMPELFASFRELTVKDFMTTIASATKDTGRIITPITCKPESTFGSVIDTLAMKSVHRIYVVGEENDVIGVITLRDVISCFVTEPPNFFDNHFGFAAQEMLGPTSRDI
ncbi:SNF1-related kinase regulatory subunit gamma-1-like, partial [Olea europaea subsp. europaea]